jgi:hypothetical protein
MAGTEVEESGGDIVIHRDFAEFMAALHKHSMAKSHFITDQLLAAYKERAEKAEAALEYAREKVDDLFLGTYMPTPQAVLKALHASEGTVQAWRQGWDT